MNTKLENKRIYLSPPHLDGQEKKYFLEAIESGWIAPFGPHVDAFESEMCAYLDVSHGVALNSGTAALHLALKVIGVKEGEVVLCPSLTFAATANTIMYEKAIPVFLDSEPNSWNLDPELLESTINKLKSKGPKPKYLIAVDLYGQSANYSSIMDICDRNDVLVIEDAAESLGSKYKGDKCGTQGRLGVLSFNGNKIITTSGGGMLVGNKKELIDKAHYFANQAREPVLHYEHKEIGYNYRMSNLLAAIGRGQLESLENKVRSRRFIFNRYYESFSRIEGIAFQGELSGSLSNRWLTCMTINPHIMGLDRNVIIRKLARENIEARPVWKPMHMQPVYKDYGFYTSRAKSPVAAELFEDGLCLPSGTGLSRIDQDRIINLLLDLFKS